jgi:hypothetical protein
MRFLGRMSEEIARRMGRANLKRLSVIEHEISAGHEFRRV